MTAADKLEKTHGAAFTCLALIKPISVIAHEWNLEKPSYCIFEYSPAFSEVIIRWGDGSSQTLTDADQLNDLILLEQFDDAAISDIFDA